MILKWLNKGKPKYPEFWTRYEECFKKPLPEFADEARFVVFDAETTGFDKSRDRILSIGAVSVKNNILEVANSIEIYLQQEVFNAESVKIHGIIRNEKVERLSEEEALKQFLTYIEDAVLVAHHAGFDIGMINRALRRMNLPKLKNMVLDTGVLYKQTRLSSNLINKDRPDSLDDIAQAYLIDIKDRHTAAGDAYITAIAFMKIMSRLKKGERLRLKKILDL